MLLNVGPLGHCHQTVVSNGLGKPAGTDCDREVIPYPRLSPPVQNVQKTVGVIGRMGGGATEQTFFVPGVLSFTMAMSPRILPEQLVQICLYWPRRTCPYTLTWSRFCLYNLPWVSTTRHSHNLCPSTLNVPRLACNSVFLAGIRSVFLGITNTDTREYLGRYFRYYVHTTST
jgi:hypothetical protein